MGGDGGMVASVTFVIPYVTYLLGLEGLEVV